MGAGEARVLLRHILNCDEAHLIARAERALSTEERGRFKTLVARRAAGEPIAYLIGAREFYSLAFNVTPAVLIPRPETELLVELALERIPRDAPCRVLELGAGSGCIAIAIARHRPRARLTATDVSADALALARENARINGARNVEWVQSDWYAALAGQRFDLVVANPPYVAAGDRHLNEGDLRFEPRRALIAGPDGLECIRLIIAQAREHLAADGWLLFEHGYDQAARCRELLEDAGYAQVFSSHDFAGLERVSGGRTPRV